MAGLIWYELTMVESMCTLRFALKRVALLLLLLLAVAVLVSCYPPSSTGRGTMLHTTAPSASPALDRIAQDHVIEIPTQLPSAARTEITFTPPPLGPLEPATGLLPSGTVSVTLALTTTAPATCRWSEQPDSPYSAMLHDFQQGQGTTWHTTIVSDFRDRDGYWFYVRCHDLTTGRNPDRDERQTHLRVLGPWEGGYPRIAYVWGHYDPALSPDYYANYDLFVPTWWRDPAGEAVAIREINPNAKILMILDLTHGWQEVDPLTAEWWNARPGDPGYNCLLRDSHAQILLVEYWGHPMYNLTQPYCRDVLVQRNVDAFLSSRDDLGAGLAYDGIFWDLLHSHIAWLGADIDSDLDGQPDDPAILNGAYRAGVMNMLARIRSSLPHIVLVSNESPLEYARWINGRWYEWQLRDLLNGTDRLSWDTVVAEYRDWANSGQAPRTTLISSAPERLKEEVPREEREQLPQAMRIEAAENYQRMRYGLASALMGDGLFFHDLRREGDVSGWYDEFGTPAGTPNPTLPPRGYLGQPTGEPRLLVDTLDAPNQVLNGNLEAGLDPWSFWVNTDAGTAATVSIDPSGGVSGSSAVHVSVTRATRPWDVLLSQYGMSSVAGQTYTLSFWARSSVTQTVDVKIDRATPPDTDYGFSVQALVTPDWQRFHLSDKAIVTADDGQLAFRVGEREGELWLDEVQLQIGALGVWGRPFENGLAVVNTTEHVQVVPLPGLYCKLQGSQAPLFEVRMDDDEAEASAGWRVEHATTDQFGDTVLTAPGDTTAVVAYYPVLAHDGTYEVLTWVTPTATQSSKVLVTIHHAHGATVTLLDETAGEVGWHSLGTYPFFAGGDGYVTLTATGDGVVVVDALKWVHTARYNDGAQVDQVTLQPQDGIILLSSCYRPAGQCCLPLITRSHVAAESR